LVAGGFNFCTGVLNTCVWMLIKSDKNVTIKRIAEEWCAKDKPSGLNFVVRNVDAVGIRVFFCSQRACYVLSIYDCFLKVRRIVVDLYGIWREKGSTWSRGLGKYGRI
jgi:hypothetical protein